MVASEPGGVAFRAKVGAAAKLHLRLRTIVRVLLRVGEFPAGDRAKLARGLGEVVWSRYAPSGVRATARKSKLNHTGLLTDAVAKATPLDGQGGEIYLRLERDVCTVSVDMSGDRLDHRGWRTDVGPAPLRETAAAAVLRIAGWDPDVPLIDPMCGSGVIPLEAAAWALDKPATRSFAFEAWEGMQRPIAEAAPGRSDLQIYGSDLREEAIEAARGHAAAAGLDEAAAFSVIDLADLRPSASEGLIVCNPPWGRRLDLGDCHAALGRMLRRFKGWQAAVITPRGKAASDLEGTLGRGPERVVPFRHGGAPVALRIYDKLGVRARSRRRRAGRPRRPGDHS